MARQVGLIKFKGNLDGLSGYKGKTKTGKPKESLIRTAGGVDGDRIKNSPEFARTRENMSEFGRSGTLAKQIRLGHAPTLKAARVPLLASKMTKAVRDLIALDAVNVRGERTVTEPNFGGLNGTKINPLVNLDSILNFSLDGAFASPSYNLNVPSFTPITDVNADPASDVMTITVAACAIDIATGTVTASDSAQTSAIDITSATATVAETLSCDLTGANAGDWVLVSVSISFAQSVNGANYPLKNDAYIPIEVIEGLAFA